MPILLQRLALTVMNIAIVGAGNIGHFLAHQFAQAGHTIAHVVSRTESNAKFLAQKYTASFDTSLTTLSNQIDLVCLTVPDDALLQLAFKTDAIVIHTSGATDDNTISKFSASTGCIWPVASINKDSYTYMENVPMCISSDNKDVQEILLKTCAAFTNKLYALDSAQKKVAHLVATIGNNFCNHLLAEAHGICYSKGIDPHMFLDLFAQPLAYFAQGSNEQYQTGAARRKDVHTQETHLQLLADKPSMQEEYKLISKHISAKY
ncbi:MAG: hypothetical protein RL660_1913 [Bacteroidota bacterium]|jgi:predicted short-subunit dehydrogenase-like oxidoreductase (DUF2520 family)